MKLTAENGVRKKMRMRMDDEREGSRKVSSSGVVPLSPMKPIQKRVGEKSKSPMVETPESKPESPKKPEVREQEDFVEYDDEEWIKKITTRGIGR